MNRLEHLAHAAYWIFVGSALGLAGLATFLALYTGNWLMAGTSACLALFAWLIGEATLRVLR